MSSKNRNFFSNVYYSIFPEKVKWHYLDQIDKEKDKKHSYEIIKTTVTVGTYLSLLYVTSDPKFIIRLLCEML